MSFEDSPSLETISQGMPTKPGKDFKFSPGRKRLWTFGLIVVMILIGSLLANWVNTNSKAQVASVGALRGQTIDENGKPIEAEVLVMGYAGVVKTDTQGKFEISGVPVGQHIVVAGYQGGAREFTFTVIANKVIDIGQIQLVSTAMPKE